MYTSGRTVKSRKAPKPTTVASATRDARRLVERCIPGMGATVTSNPHWDIRAERESVRTVITYPATVDASDLACAVEGMPGVIRSDWTPYAITIIRAI